MTAPTVVAALAGVAGGDASVGAIGALGAVMAVGGLALAALGTGRALLALLGLGGALARREQGLVCFAAGVGGLGWLAFFPALAGLATPLWLGGLAGLGLAGLAVPLRPGPDRGPPAGGFGWVSAALCGLLALIVAGHLVVALAPPADADSLAYHFAVPKRFLDTGRLDFTARAVDGAVPMLLHMTYLLARALGGELAMVLWAALVSLAGAGLLYALARRWVGRAWALALAAAYLGTPAVVYGAVSGQIETKLVLFVLVGMVATAEAVGTGQRRWAVLAGLAAGCFFAAKYTGLLFIGAVGLALLAAPRPDGGAAGRPGGGRRLVLAAAFTVAALAAGGQWYAWNAWNTGDPLFPLLYRWLGAPDGLWSPAIEAAFRDWYFPQESPAPRTLGWLLFYPVKTTFDGLPGWEAGRTGLGPLWALLLPWAVAGLWHRRGRLAASPLATMAAVALFYYVAWFLSGSSQKVRHLVPLYPALLLCLGVAAARGGLPVPALRMPLAAGLAALLGIQLGGQAVYAQNYLHHLVSGESRQAFLERNVVDYGPVPWLNAHLTPADRLLLVTPRQLIYYLEVPTYWAFPLFQLRVDLLPGASDPRRFLAELRRLGITHLLMAPARDDFARGDRFGFDDQLVRYTGALIEAGCARVSHRDELARFAFRTLPGLAGYRVSAEVVALVPPGPGCP